MKKKTSDIQPPNTDELSASMTSTESQSMTPRSKTKLQIIEAGLSTKQSSMVKNSTRKQMRPSHGRMLRNMIGGRILKKYRLAKIISMNTGLGHNRLLISDGTLPLKLRRTREIRKYKAQVIDFMERDDNSRANPGEADKLKIERSTYQTRT